MKKLHSCIIGCGAVHDVHANAIAGHPEAVLTAVADIDIRKARETAELYNCKPYPDYLEMLEQEEIDVVHICTPHYLHAPMAIASLQRGKHVLVEKPMAIEVADAEEMIQKARAAGKKLGVCFQNRYNATSRKILEILSAGGTGRILGAKACVFWHRDEKYYASGAWRGTWSQEGGGVLINQSIHTLDLLLHFLGEVRRVQGHVDTRTLRNIIEVEDTAEATLDFKNGAVGLFYATTSYVTDSPVELEIICEHAVLKLAGDLTVTYQNGEVEHILEIDVRTGEKAYWGMGHAALIRDFYASLINGSPVKVDGPEGLKTLQTVQAVYQSSRTGKPVEFK
ncbi:MAG: Gfo/Idh/MocA family protein [Bacillota bacterium]